METSLPSHSVSKSHFFFLMLLMASLFLIGSQGLAGPDDAAHLKCPRYKIYYIDPASQFFTPPVPIEDHAEYVFCSDHANLDAIRVKLKKMKPIRSTADLDAARIKVVPLGRADDAITFCNSGEITYKGKQYRLDRRFIEPSLLSLQAEGDRQRALATEAEAKGREPASKK